MAPQVTSEPYQPPVKARKHFSDSTTRGCMLGPVGVQSTKDAWLVTFGQKKYIYGAMRSPVGGSCDMEDTVGQKRKRVDGDFEPITFHGMTDVIPSEILHSYPLRAVMDCTPTTPELAMECIITGTPYLGVCYSEAHMSALRSDEPQKPYRHFIFCF